MTNDGLRLDASVAQMKTWYPRFSLSGSPIGTGPVAIWKGAVQPIRSLLNLEPLLDDLFHDRPIEVLPGGTVQHLANCRATHKDHDWMEEITNPCVTYKLEVRYRGGPPHPRAYVLDPPLLKSKKHMLGDGAICAYAPWEKAWSWQQDTVVDFIDHVLIWLVKTTVWLQAGVWLGEERRHDTAYLLNTIRPDAQCWCSSGAQYQNCHRSKDRLELFADLNAILIEYDKRNPYFVDYQRTRIIRRSRKAVLDHHPNTRFNSRSHLAKDSRPNA